MLHLNFPEHFPARGLRALIPSCCMACQSWPAHGLCANCYAAFKAQPHRCERCGIQLSHAHLQYCGYCLKQPFAFDCTVAAVSYIPPWDEVVKGVKYRQQVHYVKVMAELMYLTLKATLINMQEGSDALPEKNIWPDILIPVATAKNRIAQRGYNQAWELTKALAQCLPHPLPIRHDLLQKANEKESQIHRKRAARFKALKNAFYVPLHSKDDLKGKHIAVVDDVITTGATLDGASRALKTAGASFVSAWVFARTPEQRIQR